MCCCVWFQITLLLNETGDVFAGVGPIALAAARIVKRVYANDLNPHAVEFMEQNSVVNKLEKRIEVNSNKLQALCFILLNHFIHF